MYAIRSTQVSVPPLGIDPADCRRQPPGRRSIAALQPGYCAGFSFLTEAIVGQLEKAIQLVIRISGSGKDHPQHARIHIRLG